MILLTQTLIALLSLTVHAEPFQGLEHDVVRTRAADGAELSIIHVASKSREAPVVLIEPGVLENAAMFEGVARAFHERGYEVYVGQVRFAGHGPDRSGHGDNDGLEQVLFQDFPAHLREVAARHPGVKIDLFGHSMGGMEIVAGLSDSALSAELAPLVKAVTLVATPIDLHDIPLSLHLECKTMMTLFKVVAKLTGPVVSVHASAFDFLEKARTWKNPVVAGAAKALESSLIKLGSFLVNGSVASIDRMSPEARRKFWTEEVSSFPMNLLLDFARAAASREFRGRDGRPLMFPERIKVPVEVIRAMNDQFAGAESQAALFNSLGSRTKRLVDLKGLRHVDPIVADRPGIDFLTGSLEFHDDPEAAVRRAPRPRLELLRAACELYLTDRL